MATFGDLRGKSVVVTGGAQGIGAACVHAFAAQGAQVFFCDVDSRSGRALARSIPGRVFFARVDLRREPEVVRWIRSLGPALDVLVNNAAADPRIPFSALRTADWDDLFARNLRAYFIAARECLKKMAAGGSIINLGSITFHIAPTAMSAYVATKGGVLGFTRSLARELGPRGIRVNTLSPGWVMTRRQLAQYVTPAVKRLIRRSQSDPRLIQPGEIAEVALFLASDASRAITGQEILADRGWAHS